MVKPREPTGAAGLLGLGVALVFLAGLLLAGAHVAEWARESGPAAARAAAARWDALAMPWSALAAGAVVYGLGVLARFARLLEEIRDRLGRY